MNPFAKQRAFPRRKTRIPIRVIAITDLAQNRRDSSSERFLAHDISAGGLGLETLIPLEIDLVLELELLLPGDHRIAARAIVKNLQREKRGEHVVFQAGLQFMQLAEPDRKAISDYVGSGDFMV